MILHVVPNVRQIATEIWRPMSILFVWDVIVTIIWYVLPFRAPGLPLTLFGSALALFLGFRSNSAYQRWWEGRILWGSLINNSRSLARLCTALLRGDEAEKRDLRRTLVLRQIAYAHALRCRLRGHKPDHDVHRFLSSGEAAPSLSRSNSPNGLLDGSARRIADAQEAGWIDTIQQAEFERVLSAITDAQGGMERLKNTPLPNQYRFLPELFTRLLCILLPIGLVETLGWATPVGSTLAGIMFVAALRIGDDLVDPFANTVHDLPLAAMCRTIEIDLLENIGDPSPDPLPPVGGVLW
ncbi:bestrophin family protein [uncultured Sphingomonas sp.]|uniref:bestrophin family protein n=1 Tax=uncultured Sphingomonas sp. TaxID=158754 RepID=UPI0025D09476|nr:bestrophin family protein [uncultured Sphingomonas sp.]